MVKINYICVVSLGIILVILIISIILLFIGWCPPFSQGDPICIVGGVFFLIFIILMVLFCIFWIASFLSKNNHREAPPSNIN